jgi:hypothetical protein
VFADFHHHALWESLRILFEDRFGWELYRPTGMEWFEQNLWNYERAQWGDGVAKQYLARWSEDVDLGTHWERPDKKYPGRIHKMVTRDQFDALEWDFVISTLDHNEPAYAHIAEMCGARYGIQIGNQWGYHSYNLNPFALVSISPNPVPDHLKSVIVRQEFDLRMFDYEPPKAGVTSVGSFVNCFPTAPTYNRFVETADLTPKISFEVYGPYCDASKDRFEGHGSTGEGSNPGDIERVPDIASIMRSISLGWHDKRWSDGFGHVIHNWLALGRVPLVAMEYYDGRTDGERKIVAPLLIDGETCFDITTMGPVAISELIVSLQNDKLRYLQMCERAAQPFRAVIDFDAEADAAHVMLTGEHAPVFR